MNDEADPIKTLTTARGKFIDERRSLVIAIALGYRRRRTDDSQTNDMRETFVGLQNTIEAIERAIVHERLIATQTIHNAPASEPRLARTGDLQDRRAVEVQDTEGARQIGAAP